MNRRRFRYMDQDVDYTFLFDIRESYIGTIVTNNDTECDVALIDLPDGAKVFYQKKYNELSHKATIDGIRDTLNRRVVS